MTEALDYSPPVWYPLGQTRLNPKSRMILASGRIQLLRYIDEVDSQCHEGTRGNSDNDRLVFKDDGGDVQSTSPCTGTTATFSEMKRENFSYRFLFELVEPEDLKPCLSLRRGETLFGASQLSEDFLDWDPFLY